LSRRSPDEAIPGLAREAELARERFAASHAARETGLRLSRDLIRRSGESIRATHRDEFDRAETLLAEARELASEMTEALDGFPSVMYAGFAEDGLKEYVEASATLAFVRAGPLPSAEELGVGPSAYLNGLAEAASEVRRYILDLLRRDEVERCEDLLGLMDEVYSVLVTMDFPDGLTRGLRRTTDALRAVLERTRGDLTVALRQRRLESRMASLEGAIGEAKE
jgi:translin